MALYVRRSCFGGIILVNDQEQQYTRTTRKRKRKLRVGRVVFTFAFFIIFLITAYSVVQFTIGKNMTKGIDIDPGPFVGDAIHPNEPSVENYLLLGIDNDGSDRSRTDTMMVLSWDKSEGDMRIVSLMRDIYAEIPGYQNYKLNTAYYLGGVQAAKDTITGMFGIPIHHYAIVDFDNFESIIDIVFPKGVEMNVQKKMSKNIGVTLTPGEQKLNGQELLGYARFRADEEGDFGRVGRQQEVMSAMKQEAMTFSTVARSPKILGAMSNFVETDLKETDLMKKSIPLLMNKGMSVDTLTIPQEGTYWFNSYDHAGSVIEINLEENRNAIQQFLNEGK